VVAGNDWEVRALGTDRPHICACGPGLVALGTLAIIIMKFVTPKTGGPTLPGEEDRG
jgi:hypothetical protein